MGKRLLMNSENNRVTYSDIRLVLYRTVKQLILIILLALIVKYAFCDTVLIRTDQMTPIIQNGDRVLFSKIKYTSPLKPFFRPRYKDLIIFKHPYYINKLSCLRIAAKPGDIITIENGIFSIANKPDTSFIQKSPDEETLPSEYSPRDNMPVFQVPKAGDNIALDTLSIRNFIFLYSIIKQENPHKHYNFKPQLYIDDSLTNDYFIKDFTLYTGMLSAIPDSFYSDWFFWDRLKAYLISSNVESRIELVFLLFNNQSPIKHYKIKKDFYFFLSDNWYKGHDSRYFGPIISTAIKGKVVGIIWSFTPDKPGKRALRIRRIGKII